VDERDWICLSTIFDEENMTRASKTLYISQPVLTYHIRELEKELGIKIFVKGKGSIKFTKEGRFLVHYAKNMLAELKNLKSGLHNMKQPENEIVPLAVGETFSHVELPDILTKFHQSHPNIRFNVTPINPDSILDSLSNADSYITIIRSELPWNGPRLLLRKDPVCIVSKNPVTLNELPKHPRITFFLTKSTKKIIDNWWQEQFSVAPMVGMNVSKSDTCLEMVKRDLGYAIGPLYTSQFVALQQEMHVKPLFHKGDPLELNLFAYYNKDVENIKCVKIFMDFLKDYYSA